MASKGNEQLPTTVKGGRAPPDITDGEISDRLEEFIEQQFNLRKTCMEIEQKYGISKGQWPLEDMKRVWGKTTRLKNQDRVRWSLALMRQVRQRQAVVERSQRNHDLTDAENQMNALYEQLQKVKADNEMLKRELEDERCCKLPVVVGPRPGSLYPNLQAIEREQRWAQYAEAGAMPPEPSGEVSETEADEELALTRLTPLKQEHKKVRKLKTRNTDCSSSSTAQYATTWLNVPAAPDKIGKWSKELPRPKKAEMKTQETTLRGFTRQGGRPTSDASHRRPGKCHHCGQEGHRAKTCRAKWGDTSQLT